MLNRFDTYQEFKLSFYKKVTDFSVFDCGEVNLLKVVLDGLKVDYLSLGAYRTPLFYSEVVFKAYCFAQRMRLRSFAKTRTAIADQLRKYSGAKVLFVASYDLQTDEGVTSRYFNSFMKLLDRQDYTALHCVSVPKAPAGDVEVSIIRRYLQTLPLDDRERELYHNLRGTYAAIETAGYFDSEELGNIRIAFNNFFEEYRAYHFLLQHINPKVAIFRCHYHKEGMIHALKQNHIKCIELQHGLIAKEDIFYIFPDVIKAFRDRALFADRIWVYGNYWKSVLNHGAEYPENLTDVIGYYHYLEVARKPVDPELQSFISKRKVVLLASQTGSHELFIRYSRWMAAQQRVLDENWAILLKPHPNEDPALFASVTELTNIRICTAPIDDLLPLADAVISIYSTVLFDAKRYNKDCYSLYYKKYEDYIRSFVDSGVSELLNEHELPDLESRETVRHDFSYFYEKFDSRLVHQLIHANL